jgi:hypothetical protein
MGVTSLWCMALDAWAVLLNEVREEPMVIHRQQLQGHGLALAHP